MLNFDFFPDIRQIIRGGFRRISQSHPSPRTLGSQVSLNSQTKVKVGKDREILNKKISETNPHGQAKQRFFIEEIRMFSDDCRIETRRDPLEICHAMEISA